MQWLFMVPASNNQTVLGFPCKGNTISYSTWTYIYTFNFEKKHIFSGLAKLYFPIFLWIWNLIPFLFVSHEADQGFYALNVQCIKPN